MKPEDPMFFPRLRRSARLAFIIVAAFFLLLFLVVALAEWL